MKCLYSEKVEPYIKHIRMLTMCGQGAGEVASFLSISERTLKKYAKEHSELREALNEKKVSDIKVMEAFFKRACGYTAEEETCEFKGKRNDEGEIENEQVVRKTTKKDVPPDLNAIKWWLEKNGEVKEDEIQLDEAREILLEQQRIIASKED